MHPTDPKTLDDVFREGLDARLAGGSLHDNPYAAGSAKRREWQAGFCASMAAEDGGDLGLDCDGSDERRGPT